MRFYRTGLRIPRSGVYRVTHSNHRLPSQVSLLQDDIFPPCASCASNVQFELITVLSTAEAANVQALHELPTVREDVISEVIPLLQRILNDQFLIVLPTERQRRVAIHYRDHEAEITFNTWAYFYSVRRKKDDRLTAVGTEGELPPALDKIRITLQAPHPEKARFTAENARNSG